MQTQDKYYDIYPKIVRAGQESTIKIRPRFDHSKFRNGVDYYVTVLPIDGSPDAVVRDIPPEVSVIPEQGLLSITYGFETEQEYILLVEAAENDVKRPIVKARVYALDSDLYVYKPYKGDTHMHTYYSDGKESPAYLASECRRIGMDFIAITDHRQYAPSLEAIAAFADVDLALRMYPGEEVHPPDNPVHIVNFGGNFSINELFKTDTYCEEVAEIESDLKKTYSGDNLYPLASCVWCFEKIREAGGMGVFCHPYWIACNRLDVPEHLTDLLFDSQPFDVLELIGGYERYEIESNMLQVARYHEERAKGKRIPIVGASDSHGSERGSLFGWYYTIAFSPSLELTDLIESVKDLRSVAVEGLPGEPVRAFGPFRYVQYAQYLIREVFPLHDELCVDEGRLMLAYITGDKSAAGALQDRKHRTQELYDHLWG